jgi:hypothetical protein
VALEEGERLGSEWAVQRVHQRRLQTVGEGQAGEPAVVVDDVEGLGGGVDGVEGARDVIGLVDRLLDLVGVRLVERGLDLGGGTRPGGGIHRHLMASLDQLPAQELHDLLDATIAGWWHGNPRRGENGDLHPMSLPAARWGKARLTHAPESR